MAAASSCPEGLVPFLARTADVAKTVSLPAGAAVHAFIGNEAGDADSLLSAVCHAFVTAAAAGTDAAGTDGTLYVPVLSIPAADLAMRPETRRLLAVASVPEDALLFVDSPGLADLKAVQAGPRPLRLTLLDHNVLSSTLVELAPAVVEIVDHHVDQGQYGDQVASDRRHVAATAEAPLAGSACTVVAERMFHALPSEAIDAAVATLLTGVILIDTVNMDPSTGKGTPRDGAMLDRLRPHLPAGVPDRDALFAELAGAKFDPQWWASLGAGSCLRYDYKQAPSHGQQCTYGYSSVLVGLQDLVAKPGFEEEVVALLERRGLDALLVMSFVVQPDKRRELLVLGKDPEACEDARRVLWAGGPFQDALEPLDIAGLDPARALAFHQTNLKFSRKQLMPLVLENTQLLGF